MCFEFEARYVQTESVMPNPFSTHRHFKRPISKVGRTICKYGFMAPIIIDENNTIITGQYRWEATKELGLEVIPVYQTKHLSKAQVKAYRLGDNRLALESDWDVVLLGEELKFLSSIEIDFDLSLTAFSVTEIDLALDATEPLPEDEFTPEIPPDENIITKCGDVWIPALSLHGLAWVTCTQRRLVICI